MLHRSETITDLCSLEPPHIFVSEIYHDHILWSTAFLRDAFIMKKSIYTPGQQKVACAVREMRNGAKLTQRQLAARLKRPLNVVSRIEAGQRRVDMSEWIALCKACRVDPVKAGGELLGALMRGT